MLVKRLDDQEEELRIIVQERDDVRNELETSISKARDLDLNSSVITEENGTQFALGFARSTFGKIASISRKHLAPPNQKANRDKTDP